MTDQLDDIIIDVPPHKSDDRNEQKHDKSHRKEKRSKTAYTLSAQTTFSTLLRILWIFLWDNFTKYIHSEHKNLQLCMRMLLHTIVVFTLLFSFASYFEDYLTPSIKQIPDLKKELQAAKVHQKDFGDKLAHILRENTTTTHNLTKEITALKTEIAQLQSKVRLMESNGVGGAVQNFHHEPSKVSNTTQTYLNFEAAFQGLKEKIVHGDAFEKEYVALQTFSLNDSSLKEKLLSLASFSTLVTKPAELLSKELALLKARLIFAPDDDQLSFSTKMWNKVKNMISWKNENDVELPKFDSITQTTFVNDLDIAINLLSENKVKDAIVLLKKTHPDMISLISGWLVDAEKRFALEDNIAQIDDFIAHRAVKK